MRTTPYAFLRSFINIGYSGSAGKYKIFENPRSQHIKSLDDIGFIENKALVITWGTAKINLDSIGRILRGKDNVNVKREYVALNRECKILDLCRLVR